MMGVSRQSEKCKKCDRKDTCNEKRMEACAYIVPPLPNFAQSGLTMSKNLFMCYGDSESELIGRLGKSNHHANNEQLIDSIRKAVEQGINNCVFKVGD